MLCFALAVSVMFMFASYEPSQLWPLSMGLSRQNTGVGCQALLQGIFPNQDPILKHLLCLLNCWWILIAEPQRNPYN